MIETPLAQVSPPAKRTFLGVQALRGIAAMLVVVHHGIQQWWMRMHPGVGPVGWSNGAAGVDIFFVVSGFAMMLTGAGQVRLTGAEFLRRRIIRIVPMYWICTLVAVATILARHPSMYPAELSAVHVICSFLFLPSTDSVGVVAPVLVVGWTLCYEMFFYLLFAAALRFKKNPIIWLTPIMIAISCVGMFYRDGWPAITVLTRPIILEFLAGSLLGYAVLKKINWSSWSLAVLGVAGFISILLLPISGHLPRALYWGLPAFLIVSATAMFEDQLARFLPRWLLRIGDASYSLYLVHLFLLIPLATVSMHVPFMMKSETAFLFIGIGLSTVLGLLVYRFVEAPLTLFLGHRLHLRQPSVIVLGQHIETAR